MIKTVVACHQVGETKMAGGVQGPSQTHRDLRATGASAVRSNRLRGAAMIFVHAANSVFFHNGSFHGKLIPGAVLDLEQDTGLHTSVSGNSDFGWYPVPCDRSHKSAIHKCKSRAVFRILGLQSGASLHSNFRMLSGMNQHASGQRIPCGVLN
jgi:hypothetical protein